MARKIRLLINGITFDDANLVPLTQKIRYWKKKGAIVSLIGTDYLVQRIGTGYIDRLINIGGKPLSGGKFSFIGYSLTRNILALTHWREIAKVDTVYSISSVLDLVILPFLLKKTGKVKYWVTVLDNTVPLISEGKIIAGNFLVRLLAWVFFQISIYMLRSADTIFVVKNELKTYLIDRKFKASRIVVTGNGVEKEFILKAKKRVKYRYDGLFVGRINEAKGVYDLLKVLKIVKRIYPNFKLALMGKGDDDIEKKYKAKIKELRLEKSVNLLGFKTGQEKYDIIKSCKIFIFLSHTESVPVAPMEAVCSGKITLVYDLDAYNMYKNNEIIKFKQGDFVSVANKIIEVFKKRNFINEPGKLLLKKYDWTSISRKEYSHLSTKQ